MLNSRFINVVKRALLYYMSDIPRQAILIIICFGIVFTGLYVASVFSPYKFFADEQHEGISLIRDDQERGVYFNRTEFLRHDMLPYTYNRIEYPVLGTLYLSIPELFSASFGGYSRAFSIINIISGLGLIVVSYLLLRQFKRSPHWLWLFLLPSFLYFMLNRFDIWPAVIVQLSFLFLFRRKFTWAFIFLSIAFLAKGYAVVLFPVFFLYWAHHQSQPRLSLWRNKPLWLMFGPVIGTMVLLVVLAGPENALFPYIFQSMRSFAHGAPYVLYLQSISAMLPAALFAVVERGFGLILMLLQFAVPLVLYAGYIYFKKYCSTPRHIIQWSLIVLLLYVLFSLYYSPQWIIWVMPLLVLWLGRWQDVILVVVYDVLNYVQFPVVYNYSSPFALEFDLLVFARTILLVLIITRIGYSLYIEQQRGIIHNDIS